MASHIPNMCTWTDNGEYAAGSNRLQHSTQRVRQAIIVT